MNTTGTRSAMHCVKSSTVLAISSEDPLIVALRDPAPIHGRLSSFEQKEMSIKYDSFFIVQHLIVGEHNESFRSLAR